MRLLHAPLLALLLLAPLAAAVVPPVTHCNSTAVGSTAAFACFDLVGDPVSDPIPTYAACTTSHPLPPSPNVLFAGTCCIDSATTTFLCWRLVGFVAP